VPCLTPLLPQKFPPVKFPAVAPRLRALPNMAGFDHFYRARVRTASPCARTSAAIKLVRILLSVRSSPPPPFAPARRRKTSDFQPVDFPHNYSEVCCTKRRRSVRILASQVRAGGAVPLMMRYQALFWRAQVISWPARLSHFLPYSTEWPLEKL